MAKSPDKVNNPWKLNWLVSWMLAALWILRFFKAIYVEWNYDGILTKRISRIRSYYTLNFKFFYSFLIGNSSYLRELFKNCAIHVLAIVVVSVFAYLLIGHFANLYIFRLVICVLIKRLFGYVFRLVICILNKRPFGYLLK